MEEVIQAKGARLRYEARGWSLQQITEAFQARGFQACFAHLSLASVSKRGRSSKSAASLICTNLHRDLPAIYVLQLRKSAKFARGHATGAARRRRIHSSYGSALCTRTGCGLRPASISIVGGTHPSDPRPRPRADTEVRLVFRRVRLDLSGYLCCCRDSSTHTIIWNSASFPISVMDPIKTRPNGRMIFTPTRPP